MEADPRIERLARRLALPERAPDDAFVGRTLLSLQAAALERREAAGRRELLLTELAAGAAVALAARQLVGAGPDTVTLLTPLATGTAAMMAAWAVGWLLLSAFARRTEPRSPLR
ncbi:MAG: hypothetical protein JOZ90_15585 [Alphaproteobacteria bacterium]|nr:hypothetical protein [Alphaproteobacteria bacterium]MBV9371720.1 hypothetical protein [Alphaproteobacteria bacterium]MBV9902496.1 hypothetical protein [Alphaproteobacteria bacterium]